MSSLHVVFCSKRVVTPGCVLLETPLNHAKDKTRRKARNELPLEKRFQNVEEYENSKGLTGVRKFAEKFGCGKTQVSNILKQKTLVREEYERGFSSAKKRNSSSQYSNVNDAVWEWFKKKTEQRIPVEEARSQKSG